MCKLTAAFNDRYGLSPDWLAAAPGRVNLIGEHTDYNDGFVLPMAIERHTHIAAARCTNSDQPMVRAYSLDLDIADEFSVQHQSLRSTGRWTDYIKGVIEQFLDRGWQPQSLDLLVSTNVPIGCGLSSSAALQVAMARVLQASQPGLVDDSEIAVLCQQAEHKFAGTPVGIMDQYCIANAKQNHLVYLDCRSLAAQHIPFIDDSVAVLIIDSKVTRELRSGAYAKRRGQCTKACKVIGVSHLRDASVDLLEQHREALGDICYRRARHVVTEDQRTAKTVEAIKNKQWSEVGEQMYASHHSMAQDFEITCKEIDFLVAAARELGESGGVFGSRMTGGGFGGCTVSIVQKDKADEIVAALEKRYRQEHDRTLAAYVSTPAQGVQLL